jgi:hypothetical protein
VRYREPRSAAPCFDAFRDVCVPPNFAHGEALARQVYGGDGDFLPGKRPVLFFFAGEVNGSDFPGDNIYSGGARQVRARLIVTSCSTRVRHPFGCIPGCGNMGVTDAAA